MIQDGLNAVLHQFLLMERDPLLYLAVDTNAGGFDANEILSHRICRARALFKTMQYDPSLQEALALHEDLVAEELFDLATLNLLTIISVYAKIGDLVSMKMYLELASKNVERSHDENLHLMIECSTASYAQRQLDMKSLENSLKHIASSLERIDHPFFRVFILSWLGSKNYALNSFDIALKYYSAAYDLSLQHNLSITTLELCTEILSTCAYLHKHEMAEEFFNQGQELVRQLRLPVMEISLYFNYAVLKFAQEDYHSAILFYKHSLESLFASKTKLPHTLFKIYNNMANALNYLDDSEQALEYQLEAEKAIKPTNSKEMEINLSANIALTLISLERWDEAIDRLKSAARFYKQHNKLNSLIRVSRATAFYYQQRKDYLRAYVVMMKLDEYNQEYITKLQQKSSHEGEQTLEQILADSNAIKAQYDHLLSDMLRRQSARFLGISKAAKRVSDSARLAALHHDTTILLLGEHGSGKEVVAQMIHYSSSARNHAFISVNCSMIPQSLFESEMFGHGKGGLTGANEDKRGFLELAGKGTVFLDEIAELPSEFQMKLLKAIDNKCFYPLGSSRRIPLECKIISASSMDILDLLQSEKLRMDILHRLNALEIQVPALRERPEDIPTLVEHYVRIFSRDTSNKIPVIKDSFYERLLSYNFPGNVRELKNILERIFILYYQPVWTADILDNIGSYRRKRQQIENLVEQDIKELDKERIVEALRKTGGKQKTAAKLLNMTESTLCRKIKRYGIK